MKTPEFTVLPALTSDASDIVDLHQTLAKYCDYDMTQFGITREIVRGIIMDEQQSRYFVARQNEATVVGMMLCHRIPLGWRGNAGVYIEDLVVRPGYRHDSGIGTMLVSQACRMALKFCR